MIATQSHRAQSTLGGVVVDLQMAVVAEAQQCGPKPERVADGRGDRRFLRQLGERGSKPLVHGVEQRPGARLTDLLAFLWRATADLAFDCVQFADATQSFRRDRRGVCLLQVVKLSANVRLILSSR